MLPLVFLAAAVFLIYRGINSYTFGKKYKLPPRIPGWPVIGNTFQVGPHAGMWAAEMAEKYGEM